MLDGCPAPFAACFTTTSALALARYLRELEAYADTAWTKCSERADEDGATPSPDASGASD